MHDKNGTPLAHGDVVYVSFRHGDSIMAIVQEECASDKCRGIICIYRGYDVPQCTGQHRIVLSVADRILRERSQTAASTSAGEQDERQIRH